MLDTSHLPTTLVDKPQPQTSASGDIIVQMLDLPFPKESEFTGLESLSIQWGKERLVRPISRRTGFASPGTR